MRKRAIIISLICILSAAVIMIVFAVVRGRRPYKDLDSSQVVSAMVRLTPPDKTIQITEITKLVNLLKDVVIYKEDNSYTEYSGQGVIFTLTMADGTQTSIMAYNPFLVIDGVGYKTKYEPCEALNHYGNVLLEQAKADAMQKKVPMARVNSNHSEEEKQEPAQTQVIGASMEEEMDNSAEIIETVPKITEADWSGYFNGLNGTAVVYDAASLQYTIYNRDLAVTRSSPCSTFKIISSLIALENGIIEPENSTRDWSGEIFWNENWNKDVDFSEAFRTSCVWYYRQVIDDIGKDIMQKELERLQYGNCDISDWEGRLNTNNNNRALTGFWIESSLMISPKEQVEVMEHIFGDNSDYSEEVQNELKQVMLVSEQERSDISMYGKTGMGKAKGIVVDAWFTGFAEGTEGRIYFCVHLGRTDGMNVSSSGAKEIAIKIVSDYYNQ